MEFEFLGEVSGKSEKPSTTKPNDSGIEFEFLDAPKQSGTSFGEEVSQLGSAFVESIGRPLENMGESFESFGFSGVANALKGAITEPENYVSAGQRFMEPAPDEAQLMGFAWQYAPRAAVEQVGQVIGAIGTRAVGAAAGGAVAGPPGVIAGGFLGPAVFGAAQVIGPVAKERAMNNGREVPNNSDLVAATLTAIGSGSLDAIGAKYLPGGDKATGKFFKRVASSFVGEGLLTEAPQSVIEQIGATAGTEKGLNINVKQAVGEGLIGGTSAAGLTAIVSPFSKPAENQVIRTPEEAEELDLDSKANQEAVLLMGNPADQTQNERVTKLKEIESVIANNETLMTGLEPNAPERSKLDLENRVAKKEAEKLKAEITQGAGLSETITEAEKQQIELGKLIAAPPEEKPKSAIEQINQERINLDERAKVFGAINARQFNTQNVLNENLTEEENTLLGDYANLQVKIQNLSWRNASQLSPEDFSVWQRPKFTDKASINDELTDLGKLLAALVSRGETEKADVVRKNIEGSKRKADWTIDSWQERFDESKTQEEIDTINSDNNDWNDSVDTILDLVKQKTKPPAEEKPAKLPTMPSIEEQEAGVTYGGETGLYDVFGGITRKPAVMPKEAKLPTMPTLEEQAAETTYGGQTGVFDVFSGARRKPVVTEEPPVSMVGKQVIPGVTPVPVVAAPVASEPLPQTPENYVTVFHATDTQPNIGQKSGYYKGTYTATSKELAKDFGKNLFSTQIDRSKIYKLNNASDSQQLKKDARNAGFNVSEGNGNGETEYLISKGYEGIQRGKEIIILSPQKYKFNSVAEVAPPTEPTVKESLTVAPEAPAITPTPVEEVEFAELNDLMDRRGQAQGKVKGIKFSKKDEARYNELLPKYRSRLLETITPEADPVVWKDIQGNDIKVSQKGTFYTVENGRVRTGPAFQSEGFIEDVSPQPVAAAVVESNNIELPEGYTKQGDLYVYQPAVLEAPAAEVAPTIEEQVISIVPPETLAEIDKIPNFSKLVRKNTPLFGLKASYLADRKKTTKITNAEIKAVMDDMEIQTPLQIENALPSLIEERKISTQDKKTKETKIKEAISLYGNNNQLDVAINKYEGAKRELRQYTSLAAEVGGAAGKANAAAAKNRIKQSIVDAESELIKVYDRTIVSPTPAVSETITPAAEPAGISVGNRIKLGKSPQTYIVEEVVPQSEAEKANNEQFYSVKNERTGEVQVVEQADMKQVGGKRARKMAVEVIPKQESVTPIPEANRYTFEEAVKAVDAHFGKKGIPEGVVIVNNTTDPDLEMKAGYFVNRGQIVINLAYIAKGENLGDIIDHELGHYIFGDPEFQADFKQFWNLMTPEEKAKADQIINQFYNKETGAIQMEEKQVRAFMQLIQDSKAMPKWKQLLDKIKRWINEKLGTNLQVSDRGALAVLAAAHKRFKSGEQIVREIDSGMLKSAETAQDVEYLAAVERGDMETAQRMVDEAARKAGNHPNQADDVEWLMSAFAKAGNITKKQREHTRLGTTGVEPIGTHAYTTINRPPSQISLGIGRDYDNTSLLVTDKQLSFAEQKRLQIVPVSRQAIADTSREVFAVGLELENNGKQYLVTPSTQNNDIRITELDSTGQPTGHIHFKNEWFVDDLKNLFGARVFDERRPSQIKSADPVTYDDAGNVIPLSQRFRATSPDIRRMAAERIMGEKIGPLKKTPEGIIAETQAKLRERFDPTKVTEQNTTEAFRALGRLTGKEGTAFAQELNDIGRMVDESGAAAEVSMGAALFVNDLFEYAVRLAAEGQKMMLGIMMTNINKLPTGTEGRSDAGRALRAAREMKDTFLTMARAEQDAFINYAAEFVYGPNPTKEQVDSIQIGYDAVEKVEEPTAKEVEEEIAAVGEKTGTDLVGRINDEFTKATEKGQAKRKTEIEELDSEYKKIQEQADKEIEKLAKIQSDTPSFDPTTARQTANDVRAIVANDLKQRPDMGRKAPWKSMLVAKLQEAGVEVAAAETLADIVWRQHEINNLSRELSSINKAIEKGPISEIVKAIKDTPLEEQQNPNWRYEVMRDYLRRAGLSVAQAERIAKLMDISLQKRFTQAKEQAFTDAISKTAPWKAGDVRSKRAFQQVIQAIRSGALDPSRNMASDIAALNGWTGFSADQYKNLLKNDAILADPKSGELQKAEAYKAIQDIISKSKLPIKARDVIGQYYDAQALSGIPTLTVNSFSPIAFAMRNAIVEAGSGTIKGDAKAIGRAATAFVDSIKSWANTVAFSFKNNVTVYSNVDYIVNDDNLLRLYRKGVDQFTKSKNAKERADGVKNMMIGMMDYVRRILNALDYGAIAALQNQNISKYAMAIMKRQKMNDKQANEMFGVMMKAKNDFYLQQIAIGTDKNKAGILADEFYISSWKEALSKAGVEKSDIQQAMDAAINDALSSVGRNRQSLDAFKEEDTKLKDAGVSSMPALWLLESVANAANRSDNQIIKLFSRVIYGFAIVPARVIRETAWFSPYGFVRFGYDAIAKKMGKTSPYAQSLGTDIQYSQRLNEAVAGTAALVALLALRAGSTDDPEDEDAFKIVFTGNGPQRKDDAQFYDSWYKAGNKPNSMILSFGKTKFTLNMMRGFEAFTWPAMMLGALDDLEIRKKQKQQTKTPGQLEDAAIVAGFVFDAALRRGPYAFTTKSLFGTYGDIGVEGVAKGLTFPAKTLIPVLGTSLASNLSNFLNDPIDRRTLDGAVWSNIPFIGPAVAPKSLNAFGEPSLSTDFASKMFKLGVPIVYDIPTDRESIKLHELVLKQGGGPSIPTRNQLAQRLDRQPTNKEYEMFVREYGAILTTSMKKNYDKLFNAKPEFYSKAVERIGNRARDVAENKVRQAAKKP